MDAAVSTEQRMKMKYSKNIEKFQNFAKELKKLHNMKVAVISITVATLTKPSKRRLEE